MISFMFMKFELVIVVSWWDDTRLELQGYCWIVRMEGWNNCGIVEWDAVEVWFLGTTSVHLEPEWSQTHKSTHTWTHSDYAMEASEDHNKVPNLQSAKDYCIKPRSCRCNHRKQLRNTSQISSSLASSSGSRNLLQLCARISMLIFFERIFVYCTRKVLYNELNTCSTLFIWNVWCGC